MRRAVLALVKQAQRVDRVVHVVQAGAVRRNGQAEQCARALRAAGLVEEAVGDLDARRGGLDEPAVTTVNGEDVPIRGHGQPQRRVQRAARGHLEAGSGAVVPERGAGDRRDPVTQAVRDEQGAAGVQPHAGRPDDQGGRVGFKMRWHSSEELSLFDSIRQNLGLRVDSGKAPIEVLVIEHVDRAPVEN